MTPEDIARASKIIEIAADWPTEDLYNAIRARDWRALQIQRTYFQNHINNPARVVLWLHKWPRLFDVVTQLDQERRDTHT